jgi:hypothetical protein
MDVEHFKGRENQSDSKPYESPGLVCSCMVESLGQPPHASVHDAGRHAAIINRVETDEICFETKARFEKECLYKLNFSPVGGAPFSIKAKVLDVSPSSRRDFYFTSARFEGLTPDQCQGLLALMTSINIAQTRNHTSE